MPKEFAHLDAKRRREKPTAIGRMPPDFLFMARRRPPKKIGATSEGQRPDKTRLTKAVKEVRKSWPDSWHIIKSRIMLWAQKIRAPSRAGWKRENCPMDSYYYKWKRLDGLTLIPRQNNLGRHRHWYSGSVVQCTPIKRSPSNLLVITRQLNKVNFVICSMSWTFEHLY